VTIKNLVDKYLAKTEEIFQQIIIENSLEDRRIKMVLDCAKRYLKDARYYMREERFETALVSVVYCEGLLDALRLLGMVKFQWPQ
jgi:diphthine synthase